MKTIDRISIERLPINLRSMRVRMTLACLCLLTPFLLLSSRLLILSTTEVERRDDVRMLQKVATEGAHLVADWQWKDLPLFMSKVNRETPELLLLIVDSEDRVVWRSQAKVPSLPLRQKDGRFWQFAVKAPPRYTAIALLPRAGDGRARFYEQYGIGGLSVLFLMATATGAYFLVGRTLLPIRLLVRQAKVASVEDLRVQLFAPSPDAEMVELVGTLNGLLERLSDAAAAKGRFYSAASHELRTPLQALSGHLEVALSRRRTADEYAEALQEAHRQTARLTSLVRDLLLLHQLDSTESLPQPGTPVALADLCERTLTQLEPLREARRLTIETHLECDAAIYGVPTYAEILVRNLLENAVRYATEGSTITLRIDEDCLNPRLTIFNECVPPSPESVRAFFEPFYRPDAARNRKTGGNGLGLAICRAVARVSGWWVDLAPVANGMTATVIFIPPESARTVSE